MTDVGPIYTESLSVEQESILEIIDEEISMFADDELDGQIIVIRHDRVKAKIQEKKKSVN